MLCHYYYSLCIAERTAVWLTFIHSPAGWVHCVRFMWTNKLHCINVVWKSHLSRKKSWNKYCRRAEISYVYIWTFYVLCLRKLTLFLIILRLHTEESVCVELLLLPFLNVIIKRNSRSTKLTSKVTFHHWEQRSIAPKLFWHPICRAVPSSLWQHPSTRPLWKWQLHMSKRFILFMNLWQKSS